MKKLFFLAIPLCLQSFLYGQNDTLHLEGTYQGKNIYIQNPVTDQPIIYCITKIVINGRSIPVEQQAAFVIRLDSDDYKNGELLKIDIIHNAGCIPKILNNNPLPKTSFTVTAISIDQNAVLHFSVKDELAPAPYNIEQYKWNKWVKVGEISGTGETAEHAYQLQLAPHSGFNQFRLKQLEQYGTPRFSLPVTFISSAKEILIKNNPDKIGDNIDFTAITMFELYDVNGNLIKKGTAQSIDCAALKKGVYYLNFDSKMIEVTKL